MTKQAKTTQPVVAVADQTARALLAVLQSVVTLGREEVPALTAPTLPEGYAEVKYGLDRMGEYMAQGERGESRRTSVDDVTRDLTELLARAADTGLPFAQLPAAFTYDQDMVVHRERQASYVRASSARAEALALAASDWINDLEAVLVLRDKVSADDMQEVAQERTKTSAAMALRLYVDEKYSSTVASTLPVLAAGRGLMQLQSAGVGVAELTQDDLEALAALVGLAIAPLPLPNYGLAADALDFYIGESMVRVNHCTATLYQVGDTGAGQSLLPVRVLAATDAKLLADAQQELVQVA